MGADLRQRETVSVPSVSPDRADRSARQLHAMRSRVMGSPGELTAADRANAHRLADEVWAAIDEDREPDITSQQPPLGRRSEHERHEDQERAYAEVLWLMAGELRLLRHERDQIMSKAIELSDKVIALRDEIAAFRAKGLP